MLLSTGKVKYWLEHSPVNQIAFCNSSTSGAYNYLLLLSDVSGVADTSCLYVYLCCVVVVTTGAMWDDLILHGMYVQ